jgi:hypothetical protein
MTTPHKQNSNQTKEKSQKARPAGPVSQGLVAFMEEVDLQALQRAVANPAMAAPADILALGRRYGNRAVQRLLAQRRSGAEGFALDEETAGRINQARGGGQALDSAVQKQMSASLGHDFSGVRVHTGLESDELNQQLQARAFTTGPDIFFKRGTYDPGSDSGRKLIAHELSHVVQQSTGRVSGGESGMTVRPAGDAFEQEADALARQAANAAYAPGAQAAEGGVQRQDIPEEEEEIQTKALQRQDIPEEEELQTKSIQRQDIPEEEEIQTKAIQRQDEIPEEELQT